MIVFERVRKDRRFILAIISFALFTDTVVYATIVPILSDILREMKIPQENGGLLYTCYSVAYLIFPPIVGYISDHTSARTIPLIFGQICLVLASLMFSWSRTLVFLLVARFLQGTFLLLGFIALLLLGVSAATTLTIGLAVLADVFPSDKVGSAIGIANGCSSLGYIVGSLIGGILPRHFSMAAPFYVCSTFSIIDFFGRSVIIIPPKEQHQRGSIEMPSGKIRRTSLIRLAFHHDIILMGLSIFITSFSFSSMESLISVVVETRLGAGAEESMEAFLAMMIPSVLFSFVGGYLSDRCDRYRLTLVGALLFFPSPFSLSMCPNLLLFCLCIGYFGATNSLFAAAAIPEMTDVVDRLGCSSYARVYSLVNIYYAAGMLVGPMITSIIEQQPVHGFHYSMLLLSIICIPFIIWCSLRACYRRI